MKPDLTDASVDFSQRVDDWLETYQLQLEISELGNVVSVGDGIAWISGLPTAAMDEIMLFEDGSHGMVFELNDELIGAVLLHQTAQLTSGTNVYRSRHSIDIPVGDALLGRVVDPLGLPLDGGPVPDTQYRQPLQKLSPGIVARDDVHEPLYTGNKVIDTLIPIGKGQRQLIVGNEGLGRSSLAVDSIVNQRDKDVNCIYVLIGQKRSSVVNTIELLRQHDALAYTTIVVAEASALPGLQNMAPFSGCAIAEHWMQQGLDTLIIYDDLSTHAKTYRELSLLLRHPPGREAYPGDIFYVHARLLERATVLNAAHGGGSMTALPIIETQQGEIAAYIPTNLISITDGQIYLDQQLFVAGFRPAIDIAKSVSRIGGRAQHPRIKQEAGRIKLDYLQFMELEAFTRFGARLESSMEMAIQRGKILRQLFKQGRLKPHRIEFQLAWLIAFNEGLFNSMSDKQLQLSMDVLGKNVSRSSLDLDSPRQQWQTALNDWLKVVDRTS
jgi:F-type H+-transporting ATPase subunit alpha